MIKLKNENKWKNQQQKKRYQLGLIFETCDLVFKDHSDRKKNEAQFSTTLMINDGLKKKLNFTKRPETKKNKDKILNKSIEWTTYSFLLEGKIKKKITEGSKKLTI